MNPLILLEAAIGSPRSTARSSSLAAGTSRSSGGGRPAFVAALATAYAENGEFEKAVDTQQHAIDLLGPEDQGAIGTYLSRLELYQQSRPFRRELCEKIEDSSDPDCEINSPVLSSYLVFCFLDGT